MLKRLFICLILVSPGITNAFDVLPIDTFYSPITAQSAAYSSLNYANTLSDVASGQFGNLEPVRGSKSTKIIAPNRRATATIAKLVSAYPADVRPQAKKVFNELYKGYGAIEKSLGIPRYDIAGAVAAFIAANYMAINNVDVSDSDFQAIVAQVRQALRANRGFAKLKPAKKRGLYEQLAILGTFVAATRVALQQQPNADLSFKLKEAGRTYLEQLLNVSADRVVINSSGLLII